MATIKFRKLPEGEEPEDVINIRNKHAGYRRRGEKKRKLSKKFLEFRFNVKYTTSFPVRVKKSDVEEFENLIYNIIVDEINTDELRDAIASDPTLAVAAYEMNITLNKKKTDKVVSDYPIMEDIGFDIDFTVEPEFAWRDIYEGHGSPAWRATNYFYTGIIYPSRIRNHKVVFDKKQGKL